MVCHSTKVEVVEDFQIQIQLFIAKCYIGGSTYM